MFELVNPLNRQLLFTYPDICFIRIYITVRCKHVIKMWCTSMRTWLGVILSACGLSQPGWDSSAYSQSSTAASTIVRFLVRPSKNSVAKHLSVEKTNIARSACHVSIKSSRPAKSVDVCCTWLGLVNQEGMGEDNWGGEGSQTIARIDCGCCGLCVLFLPLQAGLKRCQKEGVMRGSSRLIRRRNAASP